MSKVCVIEGCGRLSTPRGRTCGPVHAQEYRTISKGSTGKILAPTEEKIAIQEEHRLKKEIKFLKKRIEEALDIRSTNEDYANFVARVALASSSVRDSHWLRPSSKKRKSSVMVASLSDIHAEETVNPEVMNWVNGYNLESKC